MKDKKGINWANWRAVCKSKKEEGLGVKYISLVNCAILDKRKWIFIHDKNVIWRDVVVFRYGEMGKASFTQNSTKSFRPSSIWCIDLNGLVAKASYHVDWFGSNILCKLGNGKRILFCGIDGVEINLSRLSFRKCSQRQNSK